MVKGGRGGLEWGGVSQSKSELWERDLVCRCPGRPMFQYPRDLQIQAKRQMSVLRKVTPRACDPVGVSVTAAVKDWLLVIHRQMRQKASCTERDW